MEEKKKEYKCKYCGEVFEKPLLLAHHVRAKHKRAKKREKKGVAVENLSEQVNKTVEAIGILKGLQVSPHLSDDEKKVLGDVSKRIEELLAHMQKSK
jgi:5-methylcytosine-specific restriction endonuclease McrA